MKGAPFQPEMKMIIGSASRGSLRMVDWPAMPTACSAWCKSADLAVEEEPPAVAEDDEGGDPGGEDQRRGDPADLGLAVEEERQRQADRHLDQHGADGPGQGAQEGAPEGGVLEELHIIEQAAPGRRRVP